VQVIEKPLFCLKLQTKHEIPLDAAKKLPRSGQALDSWRCFFLAEASSLRICLASQSPSPENTQRHSLGMTGRLAKGGTPVTLNERQRRLYVGKIEKLFSGRIKSTTSIGHARFKPPKPASAKL